MATTFDRFSADARQALTRAYDEARQQDHPYIGTEHLLVGLMDQPSGVAGDVLTELGLRVDGARQMLVFIIGRGMPTDAVPTRLSPRAQAALIGSVEASHDLGSDTVGLEHLLVALTSDQAAVSTQIIQRLGVSPRDIRLAVERRIRRN